MRHCSEPVHCVKLKQLVLCEAQAAGCTATPVMLLLQTIVEDPLMRHSAVLVFANKQDLVRACPAALDIACASCLGNAPVDTCTQAFSGICRKVL